MAIARKPKSASAPAIDVEALIEKGGSAPEAARAAEEEAKPFSVIIRIPPAILRRMDALLKARTIRLPRHTWILEAIAEKLERDERLAPGPDSGSR